MDERTDTIQNEKYTCFLIKSCAQLVEIMSTVDPRINALLLTNFWVEIFELSRYTLETFSIGHTFKIIHLRFVPTAGTYKY